MTCDVARIVCWSQKTWLDSMVSLNVCVDMKKQVLLSECFCRSMLFVEQHQWLPHRGTRKDHNSWSRWRRGNESDWRESRIKTTGSFHLSFFHSFFICLSTILSWFPTLFTSCLRPLDLAGQNAYVRSRIVRFAEMTMISDRVSDYPGISQGKTRIPGVNDTEEFLLTNVSAEPAQGACVLIRIFEN